MRSSRLLLYVFFLVVLAALPALAKNKDDVVVLKNGDRITGEIKGLADGVLKFKASYMAAAVSINWFEVESLTSKDKYIVSVIGGSQYSDSIQLSPSDQKDPENFAIGADQNPTLVKQVEVLSIAPTEDGFWRNLEGNINYGLNYTSGSGQYSTQLSADVAFRRRRHSVTASFDSVFSGQRDATSNARNELTMGYEYQLNRTWFAGGFVDFLQSDTQSLKLRTTAAGLVGRSLLQKPQTRIQAIGGLAVTRERYSAELDRPRSSNVDALAGVRFRTFRFKTTDVSAGLLVYPSVTDPGRVRMQVRSDVYFEIVKDLNFGVHLYDNLDSRPPTTATKNEFGVSTSIGWKF